MNIQEAILSGKPFRRKSWLDNGVFVVYPEHDIVLTLETDLNIAIDLDVQDILANDWYIREDVHAVYRTPGQVFPHLKESYGRESAK